MDTKQPLCAEAQDHIESYLDGEARHLEAHLETCPDCAADLAFARRVQEELRALPFLECPPEVTAPVLEMARKAAEPDAAPSGASVVPSRGNGTPQPIRPIRPIRPVSRWRFAAAAAAAAVLVAVLAGVLLLQSSLSPQPEPQFTAAELAQAEEEARLALAYLAAIQQRAGEKIQRDVLVKRVVGPPQQALSRIVALPQPAVPEERQP